MKRPEFSLRPVTLFCRPLALLSLSVVSLSTFAMQALDDDDMALVSGQSGIAIDITSNDPDGRLISTGAIRYTEYDRDGQGQDYLEIDGLTLRTLITNEQGQVVGVDTITTTINVDAGGNVSIKNRDINTLDLEMGAISLSGRTLIGGARLSVWQFVGDSYLETALLNDIDGIRVALRTVMESGSGLTYQFDEDGLTFSTDVIFVPASGETAFRSELFLSGSNDELRLEFGDTTGGIEIKNITLLDEQGEPLFGTNNFGDLGYSDIRINTGYITLAANRDAAKDGLQGVINADVNVGTAFYRTGDQRLNLRDVQLRTNGELSYEMDLIDTGFATGIEARITDINNLDFIIGAMTLSAGDGSAESLSMGRYAIENLTVEGGVSLGLYTLPGAGSQGMRLDMSMDGSTTFDLTIIDDVVAEGLPQPKLTAEVVLNNVSVAQTFDQTRKGLHIGVIDTSMDMNINAIRMGDGVQQQGQTGRLVMNNFALQPGSYFRIEPLQ